MNTDREFDRQTKNLITLGYPRSVGLSDQEFLNAILPLKTKFADTEVREPDFEAGYVPFVIVVTPPLSDRQYAMEHTTLSDNSGVVKLIPHTPEDFHTIPETDTPESAAYILTDIDRGSSTLNVTPFEAMKRIRAAHRFPLTIDEGIALITHFPDFLKKNNCFSLLASRVPGNKRVPALWINGHKHPNLGWCWENNPHTWLGSASYGARITL